MECKFCKGKKQIKAASGAVYECPNCNGTGEEPNKNRKFRLTDEPHLLKDKPPMGCCGKGKLAVYTALSGTINRYPLTGCDAADTCKEFLTERCFLPTLEEGEYE